MRCSDIVDRLVLQAAFLSVQITTHCETPARHAITDDPTVLTNIKHDFALCFLLLPTSFVLHVVKGPRKEGE